MAKKTKIAQGTTGAKPMGKETQKQEPSMVQVSRQALFGGMLIFIMLVAIIAILLLFGKPSAVIKKESGTVAGKQEPAKAIFSTGDYPPLGDAKAGIALVEFNDYQCPFCGRFYGSQEQDIIENYVKTGKVRFYIRDFPGLGIHDKAEKAAEAARCANEQGSFWEMHDKLFQGQDNWDFLSQTAASQEFEKYATELGLDAVQFRGCLEGMKYKAAILADMKGVSAFNFIGTPSFVIAVPKNKAANFQGKIDEIKATPINYYSSITLMQDESNYLVLVQGAMPYDLFKRIFDAAES